jgi:hypothetical protein
MKGGIWYLITDLADLEAERLKEAMRRAVYDLWRSWSVEPAGEKLGPVLDRSVCGPKSSTGM